MHKQHPHMGRKLQFVFATAHLVVIALFAQVSLLLASDGSFSILFYLPAFLMSALVFVACISTMGRWTSGPAYFPTVIALGALALFYFHAPMAILYVASAVASAWCAQVNERPLPLAFGAASSFALMAVLFYISVQDGSLRIMVEINSPSQATTIVGPNDESGRPRTQPVNQMVGTDTVNIAPALTPYPEDTNSLSRLELGEALLTFMPVADERIPWDFNASGPVRWKTAGIEYVGGRARRVGLLRVDVLGSMSTVLRQARHELAWTVIYEAERPKFGVEFIRLEPLDCFGTMHSGCTFDPQASMKQAGITYVQRCFEGNGENGRVVYDLTYPGRAPMQLRVTNSAGTGGESSWLEMSRKNDSDPLVCKEGGTPL